MTSATQHSPGLSQLPVKCHRVCVGSKVPDARHCYKLWCPVSVCTGTIWVSRRHPCDLQEAQGHGEGCGCVQACLKLKQDKVESAGPA